MSISAEEVAKVAALSRLNPPEAKVDQFVAQFNDILNYIHALNEVDTENVQPLYSPVTHSTVFRDDDVRKNHSREELLANAPQSDGRFFIVPKIVG